MPPFHIADLRLRRWLAAIAVLACVAGAAQPAAAQVVVLVNGVPITELDVTRRTKLIHVSSPRRPGREEVIKELIDDKLKVFIAKRYGIEIDKNDIERTFLTMASRGRMNKQQMEQQLERAGSSASTLKEKIHADLAWGQLIRGKFGSTLQVAEPDIAEVLRSRNPDQEAAAVGYIYTLYPVLVFVPNGLPEAQIAARQRQAESLRERFVNCSDGLKIARAIRDVAVREPITRSSADLAAELRETLKATPLGQLTKPEQTEQGFQMFAVCNRQESAADAPIKREVRQQIFTQRFQAEAAKFLDEVRRSSMIEYR